MSYAKSPMLNADAMQTLTAFQCEALLDNSIVSEAIIQLASLIFTFFNRKVVCHRIFNLVKQNN